MKVYLKDHPAHAGHWIYNHGYYNAWKFLNYEPELYTRIEDIVPTGRYHIMCVDGDIRSGKDMEIINGADKAWMYAQPTWYPGKWGKHPNFVTYYNAAADRTQLLKLCPDLKLWTFLTVRQGTNWQAVNSNVPAVGTFFPIGNVFDGWDRKVYSLPLAFDDIEYNSLVDKSAAAAQKYGYDVAYIGGRADNGFDEKAKLMDETFQAFKNAGIKKTGFFVNAGLSQKDEANILYHSKAALNVHDVFQRQYGFDTNERTFKALGLTGTLFSDEVRQLGELMHWAKKGSVFQNTDPVALAKEAKDWIDAAEFTVNEYTTIARKEDMRQHILGHHCYRHRVDDLLKMV